MTLEKFLYTALDLGWDVKFDSRSSLVYITNGKKFLEDDDEEFTIHVPYPKKPGIEFDYASYVEERLMYCDKDYSVWLNMNVTPETGDPTSWYTRVAANMIECREDIAHLLEALRKNN